MGKSMVSCRFSLKSTHWFMDGLPHIFQLAHRWQLYEGSHWSTAMPQWDATKQMICSCLERTCKRGCGADSIFRWFPSNIRYTKGNFLAVIYGLQLYNFCCFFFVLFWTCSDVRVFLQCACMCFLSILDVWNFLVPKFDFERMAGRQSCLRNMLPCPIFGRLDPMDLQN